jgi:hypothetical protein
MNSSKINKQRNNKHINLFNVLSLKYHVEAILPKFIFLYHSEEES